MDRKVAAAFVFGLLGLGAAGAAGWAPPSIVVLPSCDGLPKATCFGDHVNARRSAPDAAPDQACTTCIQGPACCDRVGDCDQDPECVRSLQATQLCVIDGGASAEARCRANLTSETSRSLYDCMRGNCGEACGVPHCRLEPEVVLFATPSCDRCMGAACCEPINKCYGNRQCKLIIECVTSHCQRTLGPSLSALSAARPGTIDRITTESCGAAPPEGDGPGKCIQRCLDEFAPLGPTSTPDDSVARCLAFGVYACGARENCGPSCAVPDSGVYGQQETWPEDRPPDAGAP